ncbi:hypothetical protein GCM10023213_23020 [Prosthecobacter algae]|uniref:Uncharacterized protein n=1 Tax=Prosthecobacter algae TaxID=1144682 RepID=A0ABP9P4Z5_9BACT
MLNQPSSPRTKIVIPSAALLERILWESVSELLRAVPQARLSEWPVAPSVSL